MVCTSYSQLESLANAHSIPIDQLFLVLPRLMKTFIPICDAIGIPHIPDVNTSKGIVVSVTALVECGRAVPSVRWVLLERLATSIQQDNEF